MVMPFQSLVSLARMVVVAVVITMIGACGFFGSAWVGKWDVTDTQGGKYTITLESGGQAVARGSQNAFGIWSEQEDKVYIVWNTGWKAILFLDEESGQHMKSAFGLDDGFGNRPITTTPAHSR